MKKQLFVIVHESQLQFLDNHCMISPVTKQSVSCYLGEFDSEPKELGDGWEWLIFDYHSGLYVDAATSYVIAKNSLDGIGFEIKYEDLINSVAYDYALKVVGH